MIIILVGLTLAPEKTVRGLLSPLRK